MSTTGTAAASTASDAVPSGPRSSPQATAATLLPDGRLLWPASARSRRSRRCAVAAASPATIASASSRPSVTSELNV